MAGGAAVKRVIDIFGAVVGLAVSAPVTVAVAAAVRIRLGSPVLFCQPRAGRDGRIFTMYKFRTMTTARDADGELLTDEQRLTGLGRFLRRSSLDEIPELVNVLRGDMSLVGPRPLLVDYLPRYSTRQQRRHEVRPGITGWAQIHGRNSVAWAERLELDVWYVEHHSVGLDMRILVATLRSVLLRQGISHDGHATMPPFTGEGMDDGTVIALPSNDDEPVVIDLTGAPTDSPPTAAVTAASAQVPNGGRL